MIAMLLRLVVLGLTSTPWRAFGLVESGRGMNNPAWHQTRLRRALALAAVVAALWTAPAVAARPAPVYTSADSLAAIAWASAAYGVSRAYMDAIALCESGDNPSAVNSTSGAVGLYQFMWSTWDHYAAVLGETRGPFNPYAAARVAAWMIAHGLGHAWVCQ